MCAGAPSRRLLAVRVALTPLQLANAQEPAALSALSSPLPAPPSVLLPAVVSSASQLSPHMIAQLHWN